MQVFQSRFRLSWAACFAVLLGMLALPVAYADAPADKPAAWKVLIYRKFLRLPVSNDSPSRRLTLSVGGEAIEQLECRLAGSADADSFVEVDLSKWVGGVLSIAISEDDLQSSQTLLSGVSQTNASKTIDSTAAVVEAQVRPDEERISFAFDVLPIIANQCYACHGPDAHNEESDLRLSDRASAVDSGAIVPGFATDSELVARIVSTDQDDMMPPPNAHKDPLTSAQIQIIKKWIDQGAQYQKHWAFAPLTRPDTIAISQSKQEKNGGSAWTARNPIDGFVFENLAEKGLTPNQDSAPARLVRRLAFDLTGLPPAQAMVDSFVANPTDERYEQIVDELLKSHHYGEHWARYWLDAVRYADTHGIHMDNYRSIWPYRDWVVSAFNENMPFDQFTVEQIAGDMLPGSTLQQKVASGYNRCLPTTNEGGSIDKEVAVNNANDRTATTFAVWQGLTAGCAACHDHKFDPLTQKEYYQLTAFFQNNTSPHKDGNRPDHAPIVRVPTAEQSMAMTQLNSMKQYLLKELDPLQSKWNQSPESELSAMELANAIAEASAAEEKAIAALPTPSFSLQLPVEMKDSQSVDGIFGPALELSKKVTHEVKAKEDNGQIKTGSQFSFGGYVRASADSKGILWSKMFQGGEQGGWHVELLKNRARVKLIDQARSQSIEIETFLKISDDSWHHLFVTYDSERAGSQLLVFLDAMPHTFKFIQFANDRMPAAASFDSEANLCFGRHDAPEGNPSGDKKGLNNGNILIGDFHFFQTALDAKQVRLTQLLDSSGLVNAALSLPAEIDDAEDAPVSASAKEPKPQVGKRLGKVQKLQQREQLHRTDLVAIQKRLLVLQLQRHRCNELFETQASIAKIDADLETLKINSPLTLVMEERKGSKPTARILSRGDYASPLEKVSANVPAMLPPFTDAAPRNRLGLAAWIVSPENPLAARVIVNRYWYHLLGTGIVETTEDFGASGAQPTHPQLLDWLAAELVDHDWDLKHLVRTIVTSSTYRQSQKVTPDKIQADPANRLLSRGPRFRLDGEQLRDMALINSGLLHDRLGGPPVKPYQPEKVWHDVAMPSSDTRLYRVGVGDQLYRRSLYTFWKRSAAPPAMTIMNAPERDTFCLRRERTNTPLQAFVMWNDPQFIEAARNSAQSILKTAQLQSGDAFRQRVDQISQKFIARRFDDQEIEWVRSTWDASLAAFESDPEKAQALLTIGNSEIDEDNDNQGRAELAAWTMVVSQIMNLDEALTK